MKLETLGWWLFLISIVTFGITLIYAFGKLIVKFVVDMLVAYNNNTMGVLFWSVLGSLLGVLLIKLGTSKSDGDY